MILIIHGGDVVPLGSGDTALDDVCHNSRRQHILLPQNADSSKQGILVGIIPFVK